MTEAIVANEFENLVFHKKRRTLEDGRKENMFYGTLNRTYAELDLSELKKINTQLRTKQDITDIDL